MSRMRRNIFNLLKFNAYPGRGIIVGKSKDGKKAVFAYFIMGRSDNSRNRVFAKYGDEIRTEACDESKVKDPSLIIYSPVKVVGNDVIVTNGDQTDTIERALKEGKCFRHALKTRTFEPDAPNFTPRISAILHLGERVKDYSYEISILKSADNKGRACNRFFYDYEPMSGTGHFIRTYMKDGNPLPSFEGEPIAIKIDEDINRFAKDLWNSLDNANKISLVCRYIDLKSGEYDEVLYNKYKKKHSWRRKGGDWLTCAE